jgi:probable addiction module antidote protein
MAKEIGIMTLATTPFDMMEMLDSEEVIRALSHIARARGMTKLAQETGLGRVSLYKALSPNAHPRFDTILKVTRALGLNLTVAHP